MRRTFGIHFLVIVPFLFLFPSGCSDTPGGNEPTRTYGLTLRNDCGELVAVSVRSTTRSDFLLPPGDSDRVSVNEGIVLIVWTDDSIARRTFREMTVENYPDGEERVELICP